ncbi:hypothetical protein D9M71_336120 [compost metagenome]
MLLPGRIDHAQARAGAVAVLLFGDAADLVGGFHFELVETDPGQHLPLIIQAQLVLEVQAAAVDHGVVIAGDHHGAVVLQVTVGIVQVQARYRARACARGRCGVEERVAALVAELKAGEQGVLQAESVEVAFQFKVVEQVAGVQVLLPALAGDLLGGGVVAGLVGVVEIAVELEQAQGMAYLPVVTELVVQARAQGLGLVVDEVALGITVGGVAADIGRAAIDAGDTAIRGAVVTAVFVLHQPVQLRGQLPAHGRREQLAAAIDAVAEAVVVLVAHVQAQADVFRRIGTEVGVQAAQVFAAALRFDARAPAGFRHLAHAVDDAALAAASVKHRSRALEHFDALDVMQVAHVLAIVADTVQIEVVAGIEAADTHAVEAGVGTVADVGDAAQCLAQIAGAIVQDVAGFHRVDGLGHVAGRGGGAGSGTDFLDPWIIAITIAFGGHRDFRQGGCGGQRQSGTQKQGHTQGQG